MSDEFADYKVLDDLMWPLLPNSGSAVLLRKMHGKGLAVSTNSLFNIKVNSPQLAAGLFIKFRIYFR